MYPLVDLLIPADQIPAAKARAAGQPPIQLGEQAISDFELLANGGFSPLTGFMNQADYAAVLAEMTLADGTPWSIPIVLPIPEDTAKQLKSGDCVLLLGAAGVELGVLEVSEVWQRDLTVEAEQVYLTADPAHPGVKFLLTQSQFCLAGRVQAFALPAHAEFAEYRLTPAQARARFAELGWRTVVGFQTRNPIHRAHEYLIKAALETSDGIFLHPLVGATKKDDIPSAVRMECYEILLEKYFPDRGIVLGVNPAAMRYAGPREAIFHAIVRRNYGCTHFIVGRDHAGVGDYYGTYDAHRIFDRVDLKRLGIVPLFFEHSFFCRRCEGMASHRTCPHPAEEHIMLSGTKVRAMLDNGDIPPPEFTRPEIATVLIRYYRQLREEVNPGI